MSGIYILSKDIHTMKTATENLEYEHGYILRLISVMNKISEIKKPDVAHLEHIVSLIREFADGLHHAKEEGLLFPLLGEKGFSPEQGPVSVMLYEHSLGREFVQKMATYIAQYKEGNEDAVAGIFENMKGYGELLQNHIAKENNVLFRMADRILSEQEQSNLLLAFSRALNSEKRNSYIEEIEELEHIYL
jgi:hemerythrin-like domain-containing protein